MATKKNSTAKRNAKKQNAKREFKQRDPKAKPDRNGFSVAGTLRGKRVRYDGAAGKQRPAKHHVFVLWVRGGGEIDAAEMAAKFPSVTENVVRSWTSAWRRGVDEHLANVISGDANYDSKPATPAVKKQIAAAQKA